MVQKSCRSLYFSHYFTTDCNFKQTCQWPDHNSIHFIMKTALLVAMVAVASAIPGGTGSCLATSKLAKYDNIKTTPAVPELNLIRKYMGLRYNALNAAQFGLAKAEVSGVIPKSGDQVAVTGFATETLHGSPALMAASPFKSFGLKQIYQGCLAGTAEQAASVPVACTLAYTAYKPGQSIPFDTVNQDFTPSNLTLSKMTKATFPASWAKIGKIEIAVVASTVPTNAVAFALDNVKYNLYKCT